MINCKQPNGYQAELDADLTSVLQNAMPALSLAHWSKLSIPKAKRTDWRTPSWLFEALDKEFSFDIDVAASAENAKCKFFYDEKQDALTRSWSPVVMSYRKKSAFCNPPFDKCTEFLQKALEERSQLETIVMLLPYRAGSRWFRELVHDALFGKSLPASMSDIRETSGAYYYGFRSVNGELRILTKRLAFDDAGPVAAFDCCVVVFYNGKE